MTREEIIGSLRQMAVCATREICNGCPYEKSEVACIFPNDVFSEQLRATRVFEEAASLLMTAPAAETPAEQPAADGRENLHCVISDLTAQVNDRDGVIADLRTELADSRAECAMLRKQAQPAEPAAPAADMINHPPHYTYGKRECIEEMVLLFGREATMAYCRLASYKYRYRAGHKGDPAQDLAKADKYLDILTELMNEQRSTE